MSEKIYAWLLCLYPSHFREAHGEEALELLRDRARDEKGFFPSLRLWLDLLADLAISVPREYRCAQPVQRLDGAPSFRLLEGESLRAGALFLGSILSVIALGGASALNSHAGNYRPASLLLLARSGPQSQPPQPKPRGSNVNALLDAEERRRVVDAAIANLKEHYIDPSVAHKMAEELRAHEQSGDYDSITDGAAFARLLTKQLRDVSHDMHLEVVYSQTPLSDRSTGPTPERFARYQKAMEESNCMFEKIEMLPHNIGYLKLNSFPDPSVCESTAKAAMASLNHADAIVFDLRDNRGGYPSMVMLIAAYLFDHPEYMYNPRENTTERSWTRSPVSGNRLADKPVYVLTSPRTFSGAEHFSYDLKMLKRATLVGEATGGATDVGVFHRIDDHFGMGIRETSAINPYSEPDWAVTGVEPDVKVKAADALQTAEKLAESKLRTK